MPIERFNCKTFLHLIVQPEENLPRLLNDLTANDTICSSSWRIFRSLAFSASASSCQFSNWKLIHSGSWDLNCFQAAGRHQPTGARIPSGSGLALGPAPRLGGDYASIAPDNGLLSAVVPGEDLVPR